MIPTHPALELRAPLDFALSLAVVEGEADLDALDAAREVVRVAEPEGAEAAGAV